MPCGERKNAAGKRKTADRKVVHEPAMRREVAANVRVISAERVTILEWGGRWADVPKNVSGVWNTRYGAQHATAKLNKNRRFWYGKSKNENQTEGF